MGLGITLAELNRREAAGRIFLLLLLQFPDLSEAHYNLGRVCEEEDRPDAAIIAYRRAIACRPAYPEAHCNLGNALQAQGDLASAGTAYRRAVSDCPDLALTYNNLANLWVRQNSLDAARHAYDRACRISPDLADAQYHRGLLLLMQGHFAEGWALHEWRWQTRQLAMARRDFAQPQWRGEAAPGRTLLIHAEQGFGDTLQFCRYVPRVAAMGLLVILEVPKPLVRLMKSLLAEITVVAQGDALPSFDLHCPMLSLPSACGTSDMSQIPAAIPYLFADQQQSSVWRDRLVPGRRVGLVWAGSARLHAPAAAAVDRRRSLSPDHLTVLTHLPGVSFYSLQKDGPPPGPQLGLIDTMAEMSDFADTAALIANLDLVISVDTAVAHLAAALGKPVWLLDRYDSCWRWLRGREDSPWYPQMKIFRQAQPDDWAEVIARVATSLAAID
jgi:Tfp pilus assembly protein PilF